MRFTSEVIVYGLKASKGDMEGVAYDSCKAYVLTPFDESKGTARGAATAEYTIGKSDEYDKYAKIELPFKAKADMEITTNGKTMKTIVHSLVPLSTAKAAA
ncbi:hypothetical protein AB4Z27_15500 [Cupriavidus sp. KB_39]|uniref:hypothetical protein n=1 Tax=Cupriavidus sp. KB_39 TaxID=3233036 RepID=UPI003F9059D3